MQYATLIKNLSEKKKNNETLIKILSVLSILIISLSYTFGSLNKRDYLFHITAKSSASVGVVSVTLTQDTRKQNPKDGSFSTDTFPREHIVGLSSQINKIEAHCYPPAGSNDSSCSFTGIKITDDTGKSILVNNDLTIIDSQKPVILFNNLSLPKPNIFTQIKIYMAHMLPIVLAIFCLYFSLRKYNELCNIIISFTLFLSYALFIFSRVNTGMDAKESINVANNLFSFPHYYSYVQYRGFLWFLILWALNFVAKLLSLNFYYIYTIYGAFLFSLMSSFLLPKIFNHLFKIPVSGINISLLNIAIAYLYGKQFLCPLPDVTPVFLVLTAWFLFYEIKSNYLKYLLIGTFISFGILIRINYLLSFMTILALSIWLNVKYNQKIKFTILLCIPLILLYIVNNFYTKRLPIVHTNSFQLKAMMYQGTIIQKSEFFEIPDKKGITILEREKIANAQAMNLKVYLNLVLKYPLDFMTMYTSRLFNGLDIRSSQVYFWYPATARGKTLLFQFINYSLIFLGISFLYKQTANLKNYYIPFFLVCFVLPSLMNVVSFVEPRYFISMSLIIISMGCLSVNKSILNKGFFLKYILFLIVCLSFSSNIYNQSNGYYLL